MIRRVVGCTTGRNWRQSAVLWSASAKLGAAVSGLPSSSMRLCATTTGAGEESTPATPGKVRITFLTQDGTKVRCVAKSGQTLMEAARDVAKIDMEAACDGTCACSTCHVYIDPLYFEKIPEADDDELDMVDLSPEPQETSRLACQVKLTDNLDGMKVTLPPDTTNQLM